MYLAVTQHKVLPNYVRDEKKLMTLLFFHTCCFSAHLCEGQSGGGERYVHTKITPSLALFVTHDKGRKASQAHTSP